MPKGRDTYRKEQLLAALKPAERYSWDALLSNERIARWLGKATTSIQRYRALYGFPQHDGHLPPKGRGGTPRRWRARKGIPGWRPSTVLSWLARTGRLTES